MLRYDNVTLDIDAIPDCYKLSGARLANNLETLGKKGSPREMAERKKARTALALAAVMQDVDLLSRRLVLLGMAPDVVDMADALYRDFSAGLPVDLSRAVDVADAAGTVRANGPEAHSAIAMYNADLRTCVHSWQLWTALEEIES